LAGAGYEERALSKLSGPAGGYLVGEDFYRQIVEARRMRGVVGRLATVIETPNGARMPVPVTTSTPAATWIGESSTYTTSQDPTFTIAGSASTTMSAHKLVVRVVASEELVADAGVDFQGWLAREAGSRFAAAEEQAFVRGSGSGQPLGLINQGAGAFPVSTAASGSTSSFSASDVTQFYNTLPAPHRATAVWLLAPDIFGRMAGAVGSGGSPVFPTLSNDPPSLLGRPVFLGDFAAVSTATACGLLADLERAYVVRRVTQIGVQRLSEIASDSGQVVFRAVSRVDGRAAVVPDAARILLTAAS
jgi:HK97 family phage major capsid protein